MGGGEKREGGLVGAGWWGQAGGGIGQALLRPVVDRAKKR
jgi:hypothetical protein